MSNYELVTWHNPRSPIAETYRMLRTNIKFMDLDGNIKAILITSTGQNEGKSLTASNLAISMAQNNNRVLLIDADLRKPVLHDIFKVASSPGITEVLLGHAELPSALKETDVENLSILTSGHLPPNPAEIVGSGKMKQLIREAGRLADIVIIDSPPLMPVTDAALLATAADGVLLVIARGLIRINQVIKAKNIILNSKARLLGMVFNKSGSEAGGSYYYYSNYYKKDHER